LDRSFSWLGRFPLAVDVADTVRVVGSGTVELLADEADLSDWISHEVERFPLADSAQGQLETFRGLRDAVREALLAHADRRQPPARAVSEINHASARCPTYPKISAGGRIEVVVANHDPYDAFRALVARSTIEVISGPGRGALAVCRAPSCGMPFLRQHGRQRWCSDACGNRARVARHTARAARDETSRNEEAVSPGGEPQSRAP
jgi:predicted RNA-binding Zn ribbon-like protein